MLLFFVLLFGFCVDFGLTQNEKLIPCIVLCFNTAGLALINSAERPLGCG